MAKKEKKTNGPMIMISKRKPSLEVSEKDVKGLKGTTVGSKCNLTVDGTISEIRKAHEYDEDKSTKYTIEIDKIKNYGSKRI